MQGICYYISRGDSMNIIQNFIPKTTAYNRRPGIISPKTCIVVHNNANTTATAKNERSWLVNPKNIPSTGKTGASWNFAVDAVDTIEAIPRTEVSWSAGDGGKGKGNLHGISIEICEVGGLAAEVRAIQLIAYLMVIYRIPLSEVGPHQRYSGKICPRKILPRWNQFISDVSAEYDRLTIREVIPMPTLVVPVKIDKTWQEIELDKAVIDGRINSPDYWTSKWEENIKVKDVMGLVLKLTSKVIKN